MRTLKVLIGPAGSGKSTYSNEVKKQNKKTYILSSDEIRIELFGDLNCQNNKANADVFQLMNHRLKNALKDNNKEVIIYDATNLSRKRRRVLYQMGEKFNVNVEAVVFFTSLTELIFRNATREIEKQIPEHVIYKMYKSIQTPQIGFDCDEISCEGEKWFKSKMNLKNIITVKDITNYINNENIKSEVMLNYTPHDTPYHVEDVNTHIAWVIKNAHTDFLKTAAIFHDLGKGLNKTFINEERATYRGHEMLGAYYLLNYLYSTNQLVYDKFETMYVVAYHMLNRNKMKKSKLNAMMTSDNLIEQLNKFNKIDHLSRVISENI